MSNPYCFKCNQDLKSWELLARHYLRYKGHSKKSRQWAKSYLATLKSRENRVELTDEQKTTRQSTKRELSGNIRMVPTICLRGKHSVIQEIPVEYLKSQDAWKIDGRIVANCALHSEKTY